MKNWIWIVLVVAIALIIMNVAGSINPDKTTPSSPGVSTSAPPTAESTMPTTPTNEE